MFNAFFAPFFRSEQVSPVTQANVQQPHDWVIVNDSDNEVINETDQPQQTKKVDASTTTDDSPSSSNIQVEKKVVKKKLFKIRSRRHNGGTPTSTFKTLIEQTQKAKAAEHAAKQEQSKQQLKKKAKKTSTEESWCVTPLPCLVSATSPRRINAMNKKENFLIENPAVVNQQSDQSEDAKLLCKNKKRLTRKQLKAQKLKVKKQEIQQKQPTTQKLVEISQVIITPPPQPTETKPAEKLSPPPPPVEQDKSKIQTAETQQQQPTESTTIRLVKLASLLFHEKMLKCHEKSIELKQTHGSLASLLGLSKNQMVRQNNARMQNCGNSASHKRRKFGNLQQINVVS